MSDSAVNAGDAGEQGSQAPLPGSEQPEAGQQPSSAPEDSPDLRQARSDASKWRRLASERDAEIRKMRDASASDLDKAIAAAKDEGVSETTARYRSIILTSELRAFAAGIVVDPDDAVRLLDLNSIDVDDDGRPVAKSAKAAIEALVKAKPYLAMKAGNGHGQVDQGARQPPPGDPSSTLRGMYHQQTGR